MEQTPDARPTYKDIASKIRADIERGVLSPGDRLPTGRELAEREGVHLMTVQNAYRQLRDEGLVVSQQGRGTFVRDPAVPPGEEQGGSPAFAALSKELAAINQTLGDLTARLERLEQAADGDGESPAR